MQILLVNDDGIHAPGLRAMYRVLKTFGDVEVVAPLIEQSGMSHRITYLHPIMVKEILEDGQHYGWAVDGSPADCTKMGVLEFCTREPDLIVSGINSGSNVGINVLYSGTVAAAIEGAFFGITSFAVSQAQGTPPDYDAAARYAAKLIQQIRERVPERGRLWSINFPDSTPEGPRGVRFAPMAVQRLADRVEKRLDPRGRPYYWSGLNPTRPQTPQPETDLKDIMEGYVTVTPLHFDLTETNVLSRCRELQWNFE
ncbi:MAG: 5'/3'-nucleotidase SurE [Planctomycetaceae bacterium]|nr:5'/3'-nucleotidase SurE [Planctomycetaceae bacterium]